MISCKTRSMFIIILFLNMFNIVKGFDETRTVHNLDLKATSPPFNPKIYQEVLNPELCARQLNYLLTNDSVLLATFLEAGLRIPKGLTQGNFQDLGNYPQCLSINRNVDDTTIEGKFCRMNVPLDQEFVFRRTEHIGQQIFDEQTLLNINKNKVKYSKWFFERNAVEESKSRSLDLSSIQLNLAICIPKPCSIDEGMMALINLTSLRYEELYCRFQGDRHWTPGLYVFFALLALLILLTLLSTSYDMWNTIFQKHDPKTLSNIYRSFSVYTNTKRLTTFTTVPGNIDCIDGIRAISMMWVVIGHTFSNTSAIVVNYLDMLQWALSFGSIWLVAAPITVDTFFMLSGFLAVYTTVGRINNWNLIKNLHLFYFNRILRMFPLLALAVLLQATVFFYIADGPNWDTMAAMTEACRINWWSTLLYVQNYVHPMCIYHSWYLAIDMQLYILSPIVLFWVLSQRKSFAWIALTAALFVALTSSTVFNFIHGFPVSTLVPNRTEDSHWFSQRYYINTLTRCTPFFVGMLFGYLGHICRSKKIKLSKLQVLTFWIITLTILFLTLYATTPMKNMEWDNPLADNFVNSFMRPGWAVGLGLMILACAGGYGGPINWFLSLRIWKLPSRLSYGIYLFHYLIQMTIVSANPVPVYFSVTNMIYMFLSHFALTFVVSFVLTLLVDSPFSTLFKLLLGDGIKKSQPSSSTKN